jgi:hypothetical protein
MGFLLSIKLVTRRMPSFMLLVMTFVLLSAFTSQESSQPINCSCNYSSGLISEPTLGNSQYILDYSLVDESQCARVCRNIDPDTICASLGITSGSQYSAWVDNGDGKTKAPFHRSCPRSEASKEVSRKVAKE